jgi:di/tricarboxylate transporter
MTLSIALLLVIVVIAAVLFSLERFSPDVVALGTMLTLVLTGLLPADRAFAGLGSDTVMLIFAVLILTAALQRTGVIDTIGRSIMRHTGGRPERLLLLVMVACCGASAFMSNTAATALFVPVVFGVAKRAQVPASKLLLPLAFASILFSSVTLISTSTNIVVSGPLPNYGLAPLSMFELAPVGVPIAVVGVAYLWLVGRRLLPDRGASEALTEFGVRAYLAEIVLLETSGFVGKTMEAARLESQLGVRVLARSTRHAVVAAEPGAGTQSQRRVVDRGTQ